MLRNNLSFRRARRDEAELLGEMTLDGIRYWGHHESFPDLIASLTSELPTAEDMDSLLVYVLERDGEVLGFYSLKDDGEHVELLQMFLRTDLIGHGYGRRLWDHSLTEAA